MPEKLPVRDWVLIALMATFIVVSLFFEPYLLLHHAEMPSLQAQSTLAAMACKVGESMSGYCGDTAATPWNIAVEGFNLFITNWLHVLLIYAIVRRTRYRHVLQLSLGAFVSYSTTLYLLAGHLGGYRGTLEPTPARIALFVLPNLPWLCGHLFMIYDSVRTLLPRQTRERLSSSSN